jgi:hypothetical protein
MANSGLRKCSNCEAESLFSFRQRPRQKPAFEDLLGVPNKVKDFVSRVLLLTLEYSNVHAMQSVVRLRNHSAVVLNTSLSCKSSCAAGFVEKPLIFGGH